MPSKQKGLDCPAPFGCALVLIPPLDYELIGLLGLIHRGCRILFPEQTRFESWD